MNYFDAARTVEPKGEKATDANQMLRVATQDLADIESSMYPLAAETIELVRQRDDKAREQQELEGKAGATGRRPAAAENAKGDIEMNAELSEAMNLVNVLETAILDGEELLKVRGCGSK